MTSCKAKMAARTRCDDGETGEMTTVRQNTDERVSDGGHNRAARIDAMLDCGAHALREDKKAKRDSSSRLAAESAAKRRSLGMESRKTKMAG
jgi:hypothetical protein